MLGSILPDGQIGPSQEKLILEDARKFTSVQTLSQNGLVSKPTQDAGRQVLFDPYTEPNKYARPV